MKIDPNLTIGGIAGKVPGTKPAGKGGSFEEMLKGIENVPVKAPENIHQITQATQISPQKINALSMSEQAIDLMDTYYRALTDPDLSLKSISSMVDDLDGMKTRLTDAGNFISEDDPLKEIMNDVAVALNGEVLKFRRGDLI